MNSIAFILMTIFNNRPDLLADYREGQAVAFEEVYHFYVDEIFNLVRRGFVLNREKLIIVKGIIDESEQMEIVQEAFVKAFSPTSRNNYNVNKPFRPYILRITKNLMIDLLRKRDKNPAAPMNYRPSENQHAGDIDRIIEQNVPFVREEPETTSLLTKQKAATVEFLQTQTSTLKTFYQYRYENELSQDKVAVKMNISRRKVRTFESKLQRALKKHLKSLGIWDV